MSDWVLFVLFELLAVVGGVFGTLIGFGVMGRTGADPAAYQRWYEQAGWRLRWLGPTMLLVAASLPVAFGVAPSTPWAEHLVGWSLFVGLAVVVVATWKREPAVGWPVGALGLDPPKLQAPTASATAGMSRCRALKNPKSYR